MIDKHTFDVVVGMNVFSTDGSKVGTITEVGGFGATRLAGSADASADGSITQASSGTGFFKVTRESGSSGETGDVTVPFNRIQGVTPEGGVILNDGALVESRQKVSAAEVVAPRRWWQFWRKNDGSDGI